MKARKFLPVTMGYINELIFYILMFQIVFPLLPPKILGGFHRTFCLGHVVSCTSFRAGIQTSW